MRCLHVERLQEAQGIESQVISKEKNNVGSRLLGPGSLAQAHKPDEFVELAELVRATEIYRDLGLSGGEVKGTRPLGNLRVRVNVYVEYVVYVDLNAHAQ